MASEIDLGADDAVLPYRVEALDVRGRVVRLGAVLDAIAARHAYPEPVEHLLAEAVTLAALMGAALKGEGRFQLQVKGDGPVSILVVDFDAPDGLRAYAGFDAERLAAVGRRHDSGALLGHGHLAFTVEQGALASRYQGIVALDGQGLVEAASHYFRQSEQIPTQLRVAVGQAFAGGGARRWRAGGLLAQFLPAAPERMRQRDMDPGDAPAGHQPEPFSEDEAWTEAQALVATIEPVELVDPDLGADRLLYRLFHERGVAVSDPVRLIDRCRCSETRIRETLAQFPAGEIADLREADGLVGVTCEFCGRSYRLAVPDPS